MLFLLQEYVFFIPKQLLNSSLLQAYITYSYELEYSSMTYSEPLHPSSYIALENHVFEGLFHCIC